MTTSLFTFVEMYRRHLVTAAHLLEKGCAFAAEKGISEAEMLGWRLADDMHPLGFQLMVVINFTRRWPARAAGLALPDEVSADLDVAGFRATIADAQAYVGALTPEQFAGRDDTPIDFPLGGAEHTILPAGQWLNGFATTNILFHLSITYAILRMKGVPIGKLDLFAGGL